MAYPSEIKLYEPTADKKSNVSYGASIAFRFEYVHRESSVPYFAGHYGVTSPTDYTTTLIPTGWVPDLVKVENRIIFAILFRI